MLYWYLVREVLFGKALDTQEEMLCFVYKFSSGNVKFDIHRSDRLIHDLMKLRYVGKGIILGAITTISDLWTQRNEQQCELFLFTCPAKAVEMLKPYWFSEYFVNNELG